MPLHLWLCKKNLYGKDFRKTSESVWRFESVHGFASVGNLYQKMYFAGSNPATGQKTPKCIYKISKNFRVEKTGEISRNLPFSRFFSFGSKLTCHHGWDSWTRTSEMQESKSCALPTWLYPNMFMLRYFITHKKYCQYKNPAEAGFLSLHHFLRPLSFSSTS